MKIRSLFFFSLLTAWTLFAEEPCEEMYGIPNISTRVCPCSREFDAFADLLVWTAREAGADCWAEVFTGGGNSTTNDLRQVHFKWDAGFRVGVGYGLLHDQWDTQGQYTRFNTKGTDQVTSGPGSIHSSFLGNFYVDNSAGKGLTGPAYQTASINWKIRFNIFDWDLGRSFWVSEALILRPFLGVKGGWIHQTITSTWINPDLATFSGAPFFNSGTEKVKNHFWGVGPQAGLNTKWKLFSNLSHYLNLFGDFSAAIMYGHWIFGDVYKNNIGQQINIDFGHINGGSTMIRTFMGFGWDGYFSQNRFLCSVKLGYEMQFWLDQLQFYSFVAGRFDNELTLQGGTLEFSFDF